MKELDKEASIKVTVVIAIKELNHRRTHYAEGWLLLLHKKQL